MGEQAKCYLSALVIASSAVSAGLWFWSARMRIAWGAMGTFNGPAPTVIRQLNKQAKVSAWAAAATGLSALLQMILGLV